MKEGLAALKLHKLHEGHMVQKLLTYSLAACRCPQSLPGMQSQQRCARWWPTCSLRLPVAAAADALLWRRPAWGMQACAGLWPCGPSTDAPVHAFGLCRAFLYHTLSPYNIGFQA